MTATPAARAFGAQSMTAPLLEVLVKRPGPAFGAAYDDPTNSYRRPVDLAVAQHEHDAFVELVSRLGPTVHTLDPLLVTDAGAIALRSGKPGRQGEEVVLEAWTQAHRIPTLGRISAPGT